jgi:uncharacterized iron-regulated membrane protein
MNYSGKMKSFNRFRDYLRAFNYLILLSALVHVGSVLLYFIATGKHDVLNIFRIIGLDMFFPQLGSGLTALCGSIGIILLVYLGILLYIRRPRRS